MGASETQGTGFSGSWVPYLALDRELNFGPGQTYNRTLGGNDSADLLANGQHTQVAGLVSSGSGDLAFLSVGGFDVPPVALQIILGSLDVAHGPVPPHQGWLCCELYRRNFDFELHRLHLFHTGSRAELAGAGEHRRVSSSATAAEVV